MCFLDFGPTVSRVIVKFAPPYKTYMFCFSKKAYNKVLGYLLVLIFCFQVQVLTGKEITNFISVNVLQDGEVETRIFFDKIAAKETSVSRESAEKIKFRQLATGRRLIQLIYVNDTIKDCQIVRDKDQAKSFLNQFKEDLRRIVSTTSNNNATVDSLDDKELPQDIKEWFNFTKLRDLCKRSHKLLKKNVYSLKKQRNEMLYGHMFQLTTPKTVEEQEQQDQPMKMHHKKHNKKLQLQKVKKKQLESEKKHKKKKQEDDEENIPQHSYPRQHQQSHVQLYQPFQDDEKTRGVRSSRNDSSLMSELFILPGTLWCGPQDRASTYGKLGGLSKTDICCRRHDQCKLNIHGYTKKFGLYNYRPFTMSHCNCDSSFRTCLKVVDTSDSNLVGKLFFNVVQTKCFVIKPKKICSKHSWWGDTCEEYSYVKQAVLRDNLPY